MELKKNFLIFIFLITTITLTIININNTSKTYLYFLNLKTEKITLGGFITISFLTGLATSFTFSNLTSSKNENNLLNEEILDTNSETQQGNSKNNNEIEDLTKVRPPERDIRDAQPTISVNYRVIKQNDMDDNDINEVIKNNRIQRNDDWEEIESNW